MKYWVILSCLLCASVKAENYTMYQVPFTLKNPPKIEAKAWALMELNSGWIVAGENINHRLPQASITKTMTNYVVFQALKNKQVFLNDAVKIPEKAWRVEGSRMFANVGEEISLELLLKSTMVQSGNDAAIALAEYTFGGEEKFIQKMNETAHILGLKNTHFVNSTGLHADQHYTSVSDIALLSARIIRDFPDYYPWYAQKSLQYQKILQYNRNKLLWKKNGVDGIKTGYTKAAGYCLVGSAIRNNTRWIAVVLGAKSAEEREVMVEKILNYGFDNFVPFVRYGSESKVASVPVEQGVQTKVNLAAKQKIHGVYPKNAPNDLRFTINIPKKVRAPVLEHQTLGVVSLYVGEKKMKNTPLSAKNSVIKASWWEQRTQELQAWFAKMQGE